MTKLEWTLIAVAGWWVSITALMAQVPSIFWSYILIAMIDIVIASMAVLLVPGIQVMGLRKRIAQRIGILLLLVAVFASTSILKHSEIDSDLAQMMELASRVTAIWGIGITMIDILNSLSVLGLKIPASLSEMINARTGIGKKGEEEKKSKEEKEK